MDDFFRTILERCGLECKDVGDQTYGSASGLESVMQNFMLILQVTLPEQGVNE